MAYRESQLTRSRVSSDTSAKKLFIYTTDDLLAEASIRTYYESVKDELGDGDILTVRAKDGSRCLAIAKDRNGNISSLTDIPST